MSCIHPSRKSLFLLSFAFLIIAASILVGKSSTAEATVPIQLHAGDTWVFLGDSITDAHLYSDYLESYYQLRYPNLDLHFRGEGRGGSTIPEATDQGRYERRVDPMDPNIVSEMFGQNNNYSSTSFATQTVDLIDNYIVGRDNAVPVLFGPHPVYTTTGKPMLGLYSDFIRSFGETRGFAYADIWHYLFPIWSANLASSTPVNLQYGDDSIHPGPSGHLGIAYALLRQLNAEGEVSSATIDAFPMVGSGPTVISESHAHISNLSSTATGIDFTRLDDRLPMAYDSQAAEILKLMPQVLDMNRYMLKVQNLEPGMYDVYIDNVKSATVDSAVFAAGWNMSEMTQGPIYAQTQEVLGRIRDKEGIDRVTRTKVGPPWKGVTAYKSAADAAWNSGLRGEAAKTYLAPRIAAINSLDALIHAAAEPLPRNFSLRKAGSQPNPPQCTEQWQCGQWSACSAGTQTRTCVDANACGTTANKPSESQSCAVTPPTPPTAGLVAEFLFDSNSNDTNGNYNGVATGVTYVPGKANGSAQFDASTEYVEVGSGSELFTGKSAFSITGWVKFSDTVNTAHEYFLSESDVLSLRRHTGTSDFYFYLCTTTCVSAVARNTLGNDTAWHHVAATWDGSIMRVYVDGAERATKAQTGTTPLSSNPLYIGSKSSSNLRGNVDQFRFWNRALTASEIASDYSN